MQIFLQKNALYPSFFLKNAIIVPFFVLKTVKNGVCGECGEYADEETGKYVHRKMLTQIDAAVGTDGSERKEKELNKSTSRPRISRIPRLPS